MKKELYEPYRAHVNHGVEVSKTRVPPMNAGGKSETIPHYTAKCLVALAAAQEYGYMTDIEVPVPSGDIDVLIWGHPERLTYAVECEVDPTEETKQEKLDKYVKQIPSIDDMVYINVNNIPMDMIKAVEYIRGEI